MATSSPTSSTTFVPRTCVAAGAILHTRDGHTVAAHYGSVQGELAVCMKSVGLADRSDLGVFELRGDQALLDRALIARFGDPPLATGNGRRLRSVWYLRVDARHTLLVGPHAALAHGPAIGKAVTAATCRTATSERRWRWSAFIGRVRAPADGGRPTRGLAIGAIGGDPGDPAVVAILREPAPLPRGVRVADVEPFWSPLLHAGEPLGAASSGADALGLLNVASLSAC